MEKFREIVWYVLRRIPWGEKWKWYKRLKADEFVFAE